MKFILLTLLGLSMTGCATYGAAFKSEATLRDEHFARQAQRSPEQIKHDQAVLECVGQANAYGGSTPQGHKAIANACLASKGL